MWEEENTVKYITSEMIDIIARIWMRSTISIIDVRYKRVHWDNPLKTYRLPGSMIIFTYGGSTEVKINQAHFRVERFGVFHGGKGSILSVIPVNTKIETYMVLYKAESSFLQKRELHRLLEQVNPFVQQYGYSPRNSVRFTEMFRDMLEHWNSQQAISHLYVKNLFFQIMYEIYKDLNREGAKFLQPDPVSTTKYYLDEYFRQPIRLKEIADMFAISSGQLTKLFKKREGKTLQDYLIQKRLQAACIHLESNDATIQEISSGCGFIDELNLIRMFKKHYKMTPSEYRKKKISQRQIKDIDNHYHRIYNLEGLDSLDNTKRDGEFTMLGQVRNKEMLLTATMCLMLFLTACTSGTPTNNVGKVNQGVVQEQKTTQSEVSELVNSETRTITTIKGDVEVPNNPQRVVVDYLIGDVVALGVIPLGVVGGKETVFDNQIADSNQIAMEPEDIMTLEPDLIILSLSEESYKDLSKIAPTVYVPYGDMNTEERVRFIGDVLNKQEEAEAVLKDYANKVEESKRTIHNAGLSDVTVTVGQFTDKNSYIAGAKHALGVLVYNELQMKAPSKVQTEIIDTDNYWADVSLEVLPTYVGDYVISLGDVKVGADNEVWNLLPAVQHNRIVTVATSLSWYTDILSSNALMDYVVNQLLTSAK